MRMIVRSYHMFRLRMHLARKARLIAALEQINAKIASVTQKMGIGL